MPPSAASKCRKWCFTLNNPQGGAELYDDDWVVNYLVVGAEVAPDTGTPHHQGYVNFANPRSLAGVRKLLPRAHWEPVRGSEQENFDYCSKEDSIIIECGQRESEPEPDGKRQGSRSDISNVRALIKQGHGMRAICEIATSYQSLRGAELLLKYCEPGRTWKTHVTWIYGPTGVGKTTLAERLCQTEPWVSGKTLQWFQGYDAHEDCIFDEFRGDYCTLHELLRLFDKLKLQIEHKGGSRQFLARRIVVTSCYPPEKAYRTTDEDLRQLGRRIETIVWMPERGRSLMMPGTSMGQQPMTPFIPPVRSAPEPEHKVGGNTTARVPQAPLSPERPPTLASPHSYEGNEEGPFDYFGDLDEYLNEHSG